MKPEEAIEVLQALKFIGDFDDYSDRLEIAINMGIKALKERPHGEWIPFSGDSLDVRMKCSVCGSIEMPLARHNFCPHCGADMKEGETE